MHKFFLLLIVVVLIVTAALAWSGRFLVIDHPEKADVIVILFGDHNDRRFYRGLELLRAGYGKSLFVDASNDEFVFGRTPAELEQQFITRAVGELADRVRAMHSPAWNSACAAGHIGLPHSPALSIFARTTCLTTNGRSLPQTIILFLAPDGGSVESGPRPLLPSG